MKKIINKSILLTEKQLQLPLNKDNGHIVVLAGSPGSGKSYSIENFTNITDHAAVLDIDTMKNHVRKSKTLRDKFKQWLNVAAKDDILFRDLTDLEIIDDGIMKDTNFNNYIHDFLTQNKYFYKKLNMVAKSDTKKNIILDGTLRYIPSVENKIEILIDSGYSREKVHLVYVYTSLGLALSRNSARARMASDTFVRGAYKDVMDNVMEIIRKKRIPSDGTGSFSIIVNEDGANASNLVYYRIMKDGVWNEVATKKFIDKIAADILQYRQGIAAQKLTTK